MMLYVLQRVDRQHPTAYYAGNDNDGKPQITTQPVYALRMEREDAEDQQERFERLVPGVWSVRPEPT